MIWGHMFSVANVVCAVPISKIDSEKEVNWLAIHEIKLLKNNPTTLYIKGES